MSSPNQQPVVEDIVTVFETTQNQSWSIFNDKLNSVSNKNSKKKDPVKSENSITLTNDDVPVFGLVPRLDKVMLVSCNECAMIVKRDCIHSHFYRRHNSNNVSHSEADKFSLVNFLSTVKTNKNKKLKMTVRKPPEKKINEREKVNTVVKEIKTEFDQVEYERLLEANRAKIKEENTTEYVDQHNVDIVTTSYNPSTSSGNFDWDVKPCIKSETQCTDHKVNEEIIEHNKDFNKLSTVSLDNKKDLQSNKYLDIQNTEHDVNCVTSPNRLLKLDRNKKMKPEVTIDFSGFMYGDEEEYYKKYHKYKNKYQKLPHIIKNIKEKSKLTIKNEYSDIMDNKKYNDISTFYNQSSNTSTVDIKIEYYKLFSRLQNDCEQTKLLPCNKYLDIKNEIPSYHQRTESPKEEFKNIPNNRYPDITIKEEYDENNDKYKVELSKCSSDNNNFEVISNTCSSNVDSNLSTIFPCSSVSVKEEVTITESSENIINNESSDNTIVSNNQSSIALPDINEVSKPLLTPTNTIEESKSSLSIDLNNEKSKHSLITDYITDNSYTEYYQLYTNSIPQLSPSYKYLDDNLNDEFNLQVEDNLNDQLSLQVEEDLNNKLNFQEKNHFNYELNLQRKENLSDELSLQIKEDLNDELYLQDEDLNDELFLDVKDFIDEIDLQPEDDLTEKINWQSDDDLDNELNFQGEENLNVEFNLQGVGESSMDLDYQDEDNLRDELSHQSVNNFNVKFSLLNEDNLSNREDLNDEKNLSSKENLNSVDVKINNNLKYDCLMPSTQLQNNEEETKQIPSKECSVIINNESSNVTVTDHDQSSTVTLANEKESEVNSIIDDAYVVVDNDGIVDNFENEYYRLSPELYDHDAQTSFTPTYKYSDVISNESSDNSDESISTHDQSSIESLDVRDQTDNSSTENSSDFISEENLYDSDSTIGSSNQSTELYDMKKPKYTQINCLEDHEQFIDRISEKLAKSFSSKIGKNNCTHTNAPLECMHCCKTSEDFIDASSTQIDEHSVPIKSNIQINKYDVINFTPISSSAQIINNTIIPKDVEEYELKDNNDCDCNVSNKSHYLTHFHPHPCYTASQNNNLMHSSINENDCRIYSSEHYKSNEHILHGNIINELKPFIDKNNDIYKEFMKIVDNSVPERKCKIMSYTRIVKNLKRKLKRRVADDKENRNHLISRGFKKFKMEFIDRDISCSDESDNNDNVDD